MREGCFDGGGCKGMKCTGCLGLFLYPIPPLNRLSCFAVHILYIVNVNTLLMLLVLVGFVSAQIDGPCLQVYSLCATEGR